MGKAPGGGRQQVECEHMVCLGSDESEHYHGYPGLRNRSTASRWKKVTISFFSALIRPHLKYHIHLWGLQAQVIQPLTNDIQCNLQCLWMNLQVFCTKYDLNGTVCLRLGS